MALSEQATVEIVVYIAIVLGTVAGTLYPYWSKLREFPEMAFEKKFLGTAVISFIASLAISVSLFPTLLAQATADSSLSLASVFAITALSAFGLNRASNMIMPGTQAALAARSAAATAAKTKTTATAPGS